MTIILDGIRSLIYANNLDFQLTTSETDSQIVLTSFKTVILKGTKRACVAVSDGKVKLDDKNAKPKVGMATDKQKISTSK